jgi:hypothetical protein
LAMFSVTCLHAAMCRWTCKSRPCTHCSRSLAAYLRQTCTQLHTVDIRDNTVSHSTVLVAWESMLFDRLSHMQLKASSTISSLHLTGPLRPPRASAMPSFCFCCSLTRVTCRHVHAQLLSLVRARRTCPPYIPEPRTAGCSYLHHVSKVIVPSRTVPFTR